MNTTTGHTPGPWGYDPNGPAIIATTVPMWGGDEGAPRLRVVDLTAAMGGNATADARLIAAAPDLLESLRLVLPLAERYLKSAPTHPDNAKLETARAALVKAERG